MLKAKTTQKQSTPATPKPNQIEVTATWRCPPIKPKSDTQDVLRLAATVAAKEGATVINIRSGIHPKTYGPNLTLIPDPDGDHITFEYFRPKERDWVNVHLYVRKGIVKGKEIWIENTKVKNNPRLYKQSASWQPQSKIGSNDRSDKYLV